MRVTRPLYQTDASQQRPAPEGPIQIQPGRLPLYRRAAMPQPADAPPPLRVNRAPVLTLWAAVVAERLGHPEETALTLGAAVAGTAARAKARRLGLADGHEEHNDQRQSGGAGGERRTVRLLGREVPVSRSDSGPPLAAHDGRPQSPASVTAYLARAFGDRLGEVRAAMEGLASSLAPEELNRVGFRLYERFRPEVPEGVEGWSAKAVLDIGRIGRAAE